MKRYIFLILFLPILVMSEECTTYNDIDSSTYKEEILDASDKEWITCKEESSPFNPTKNTNRIEALKMSLLAGGHNPPDTSEECFKDVLTDSWQNKYVCYAKKKGFIKDNPDFNSSLEINFAEASKMILKSMTNDNYGESEPWYQKYLDKMALYKFEHDASSKINRDYFVYILTEIEADPNKQAEVKEEEQVEDNETTVIDDNITIEDNEISNFSLST